MSEKQKQLVTQRLTMLPGKDTAPCTAVFSTSGLSWATG